MTKKEESKNIKIPLQITVKDLSTKLDLGVPEVIKKLMDNGIAANINESIDYETAFIIAEEFDFKAQLDESVSNQKIITFEKLQEIIKLEQEKEENLSSRPPVVTILGHVDHGKTTLLDTLRKTHIVDKEAGGITQHINAYQIKKKGQFITFVDTPGHEAFQSMRQRGAMIADIAILVIAADDGVKPQTKEVIDFLLKNKISTIVAINKVDKPEANINKIKQELAEANLLLEGYGGKVPFNEISAKNNTGLDELLDTILLISEVGEFKADNERDALGIVLEAHKDPEKGPLATILVKTGTLKIGQNVIVGNISGKIRKIEDCVGKSINTAPPSSPVTIIGLSDIPKSNNILHVEKDYKKMKKHMKSISDGSNLSTLGSGDMSSKQLIKTIDSAKKNKLPIVLKVDVNGTLEAITQIFDAIKSDEVSVDVIKQMTGPITESDIKEAHSAGAIIYGFGVNPTAVANRIAKELGVEIKTFSIIYELIEDVKNEMSNFLEPEIKRTNLGKLKVLAIFKTTKKQMIVGGKVSSGKLIKGQNLEITRKGKIIGLGKLVQLQQNKNDVDEVKEGFECGVTFEGKEKIEVGDAVNCFQEEEIKRKI
jgi:translation initiation factor IF-2